MDVRVALPDEIGAIRGFGATHIPQHYGPLLGFEKAQEQVDRWWTLDRMSRAVSEGRVVVAEKDGDIIGVGEWSLYEGTPVIWKLYVHPSHRGSGVGPRLIDAIIDELLDGTTQIQVEHFAVNRRASVFYEREGFRKLRTVEHPTNPTLNIVWSERFLD